MNIFKILRIVYHIIRALILYSPPKNGDLPDPDELTKE